jgi:hypothetical protein
LRRKNSKARCRGNFGMQLLEIDGTRRVINLAILVEWKTG